MFKNLKTIFKINFFHKFLNYQDSKKEADNLVNRLAKRKTSYKNCSEEDSDEVDGNKENFKSTKIKKKVYDNFVSSTVN